MTEIELAKIEAELAGVSYAKKQMKVKILQLVEEIERNKANMEIQEARERELQAKLEN